MSSNLQPSFSSAYSSESVSVNGVSQSRSAYCDSTGAARSAEARGLADAAHATATERLPDGTRRSSEKVIGVDQPEHFERRWDEARQAVDPQGRILPADSGRTANRLSLGEADQQQRLQQ